MFIKVRGTGPSVCVRRQTGSGQVDRHADGATSVTSGVYVLELAGTDDEFAAYEAGCVASDVSVAAPGLATARGLTDRFDALAYTHRASELVETCDPTVADARSVLGASRLDRAGTVAVRAVDVRGTTGVDTQAVERELGGELVDQGFGVDLDDPDHELRALFAGDTCALGWLVAETEREFARRRPPDRPFVQPGSMSAMLARALANMAGARPGATVLDPMCGTGGILVEAGLVGARTVGVDVQQKMASGARENLDEYLDGDPRDWSVVRGDAASLPVAGGVDAVVFDTPYGRQSKVEGNLSQLVLDTLREARRVASRCVVVGDRPWAQPAASAGWTTEAVFDRRVHRSLTRYIVVLRGR
jgi:tRNA (guanine10-N2)-dimethyltransferase